MLLQNWKIALCLLAVGSTVHAQQNGSTRVFKVGGTLLEHPAERASMQFGGRGRATSGVDASQALAPVARAGSREPARIPGHEANAAVERTPANRLRDNAIEVAEKRVEFARQQAADLESYNRWNPPQSLPPMSVLALPHSMSYSPVDLDEPVQSFVPRSTFAHVLVASERELTDAELHLATLVAERDSVAANKDSDGKAETIGDSSDDGAQLAHLEVSLQRERFMAESAEMRLNQLSNLSRLTYSGTYRSLYQKLELERLEHELAARSLEVERDALEIGDDSR